jgi:hypothetical protein
MNCETAKSWYYDYLEKPDAVAPDILSHIEQCSVCRAEIGRLGEMLSQPEHAEKPYRPKYLELHYQLLDRWVSCEEVIGFLPSLLLPQLGLRGQTPVTVHVDCCPNCQAALRTITALQLNASELIDASCYLTDRRQAGDLKAFACAALDKVRQKCGSDVLTRMRFASTDNAETQWLGDAAVVDVKRRTALPRRAASIWITSGVAAAILLAVLLILPTSDVKALDVAQLYMTFETVRNVHIQKHDGSKELEHIWISDGLGAYLFQQDDQTVFVDRVTGKIFQQHQGAVQLVSQGGKMELERPWGLLPFKHISQLPASYHWEQVSDTVLAGGQEVLVYEWTWTEGAALQNSIQRIWRGYLDRRSHLPYRIEWLDKVGDSPAELIMEMDVYYPSDAECRDVFERFGFGEMLGYGDQNGRLEITPSALTDGSTDSGLFLSTWPSAKTALNLLNE